MSLANLYVCTVVSVGIDVQVLALQPLCHDIVYDIVVSISIQSLGARRPTRAAVLVSMVRTQGAVGLWPAAGVCVGWSAVPGAGRPGSLSRLAGHWACQHYNVM